VGVRGLIATFSACLLFVGAGSLAVPIQKRHPPHRHIHGRHRPVKKSRRRVGKLYVIQTSKINQPDFWTVSGQYVHVFSRFRIITSLNEAIKNSTLIGMTRWVNEQKLYVKSAPDHILTYAATVKSVFVATGLVSICNQVSEYTGGAHSLTYFECGNWQELKGKWDRISIKSLFEPGLDYKSELNSVVIPKLKSKGAQWVWSKEMKTVPTEDANQFTASKTGLIFHFAPYEAGPYSQGIFTILVPFREFKGLRLDGPLKRVLKLAKYAENK